MSETANSCEHIWHDAIEQCRNILDSQDFKRITNFNGPEQLLQELRNLEQKYTDSVTVRLLKGVGLYVTRLQTFLTVILKSIGSNNIKAACVWGATALLIELASQSQQALEEITSLLNELGNKLVLFEIYKEYIDLSGELLETFFNTLVDHVLGCVEAIKHFRENDILTAVKILTWARVKARFLKIFNDLDSKIDHLHKLTKAQSVVELNRTQAHLVQKLAKFAVHEEKLRHKIQLPCISLPFQRNYKFFGREIILNQMHEHLNGSRAEISIRSLALWGTGGIGKTQIALEYAARQVQNDAQVVLWICSETEEEMINSFVKVADKLQPPGYSDNQTPDQKRFAVLNWLQKTTIAWLIVFDNVVNRNTMMQNWPVDGTGSIIVTCRSEHNATSPINLALEVTKFDIDDSIKLIFQLMGKIDASDEELTAARRLAERVGGLALAIDILAKQILMRKRKVTNFELTKREHRKRFLTRPDRGFEDPYYSDDLSTIWFTAFESMSENSAHLLSLFCFAAPDEIPQAMLHSSQAQELVWPFLGNFNEFEEAKLELVDLSLIRINSDSSFISIHRLTQDFYMDHIGQKACEEAFRVMSHLVGHAFPKRGTASSHHLYRRWQSCEQLVQHVIALQEGFQELHKLGFAIEDGELTRLMSDAAWYLAESGSFQTCHRMVDLAAEACSDKTSLFYAGLSYSAGSLDHRRGRYSHAVAHYEQALKIREMLSEPDSNELATTYSAVGMALTGLYNGEEALKFFVKAFSIFDAMPDAVKMEKFNVDRYLRNRGRAKMVLSMWDEAKRDLDEAEMWETKIHGERSHYHGESQFELGKIAAKQGKLDLAAEHFQMAYVCLSSPKPTHQSVMAVLYHQGLVCMARNTVADNERAWGYLDRCLAICQLNELRRGDQGESARVKWQMAKILERQGLIADAEAYKATALLSRAGLQRSGNFQMFDDDDERSWDCFLALLYR